MQIVRTLIQQGAFLQGQGEVVLSGRVANDAIVLDVAHPGCSVPQNELPALFDPFPSDVSTALGEAVVGRLHLAFARSLASLNGGVLTADSRMETGVVFTLKLPVEARTDAKASGQSSENQEAAR